MEQATPLTIPLDHFKDVKTGGFNLSVEVQKGKLITFCRSEWPAFDVGWPPEGTFYHSVVQKVKEKIFLPGQVGHPDQIPYILVWQDLMENPLTWLTPFLPTKILALRRTDAGKPTKPSAPLYPVLPESLDLLSLDPSPYLPPPLNPRPAEPVDREAQAALRERETKTDSGGPAERTRGCTQRAASPNRPDTTVALPLREIGPPDDTGNPRLRYWPFSTSDLYNWKTQNARFSDNPKDLISLLDSVMFTHQPTWDDCQQLL